MNQTERESREALYGLQELHGIHRRKSRKDRAFEVSVIAFAGLVIVVLALVEWWRQ